MNRIITKQISYVDKLDLALKICQTAPLGYTGFDAHKPIKRGFISITYAKGIGGSYLSLEKLAIELGISDADRQRDIEPPSIYAPSSKTWDAVMQGKKGFILLR